MGILDLTKKILNRKYKIFSISNGSIVSFVLILSIVSVPFSFIPKKAEAQSISGYTSGLGVAITKLPQCSDLIGSGIKDLFGGSLTSVPDDYYSQINKANESIKNGSGDLMKTYGDIALEKTANEAANELTSVPVYDSTNAAYQAEIKARLLQIEKSTSSINANSTCIQSIGRLVIKTLLQKLTMSTVDWINSGFEGSPSFIQNPSKFFNDIAKNEILQFGLEINDTELFPFGKAWMQNTALAFNNKFQDNAKYSLNELIQQTTPEYSAETFKEDFSQGGWNAWTAMTQVPANNPLGFQLMASNELQKRLEGTTQSTAEQVHEALSQADGFLGDMRCSADQNITQADRTNAFKENKSDPCVEAGGVWQYVTPGKMIADAATNVIGYQNNAYLNVEDLNDAVAAVMDALLGEFSNTIYEKGFANIGTEGSDGNLILTDYANLDSSTQTEKDFDSYQLSNSSWLSSNPDFNIRTDLTQALIDEQRTYIDKLNLQNKELLSTVDGKNYDVNALSYSLPDGTSTKISNTYGLISTIYQLDYCIPGPHPGWETDSQSALNAALSKVTPETVASTKDKDLSAVVNTAKSILPMAGAAAGATVLGGASGVLVGMGLGTAIAPVIGTIIGAVVGTIVVAVISLFAGDDDAANVRAYYATIMRGITGYQPDYNNKNDDRALNIESKSGLTNVLNTVLVRYKEIINKIYFTDSDLLPSVTTEATTYYEQLPGYYQMIKNNTTKVSLLNSTINTLNEIKGNIDELNEKNEAGLITSNEYENEISTEIKAFGRISANMVNGNDIANADNILKQIKDKKVYVYNNLLKGPYGCEAFLQDKNNIKSFTYPYKFEDNGGVAQGTANGYADVYKADRWDNYNVTSVKRMTYPFPILYDYNLLKNGQKIPDPLNSGFSNKIIVPDSANNLGPGFLSFINFTHGGPDGDIYNTDTYRGPERLKIHDLVPENGSQESRYVRLGQNKYSFPIISGPFESMIGIY